MPDLDSLRDTLVAEGTANLAKPRTRVPFTGDDEADELLNDIDGFPHAFLFGCLVNRQMSMKRAWLVPSLVRSRLGSFDIVRLVALDEAEWVDLLRSPTPAHRMPEKMATVLHRASQRLADKYACDASQLWTGNPPSADVVTAFRGFHGAAQKIASMGANILVRDFHVPMQDYTSIDISADTHTKRVMARLGFVPDRPSVSQVVDAARILSPDFPGIFDLALLNVGLDVCRPRNPRCSACRFSVDCTYAASQPF